MLQLNGEQQQGARKLFPQAQNIPFDSSKASWQCKDVDGTLLER